MASRSRRYNRDKIGRFSGSGSKSSKSSGTFKSARKATASGRSARSDASMMKTLKGGEKEGGQISSRAGRRSATTVRRSTGGSEDTKFVGRAASAFKKDANKSKVKQRKMEKERKSLARKGARRGGK